MGELRIRAVLTALTLALVVLGGPGCVERSQGALVIATAENGASTTVTGQFRRGAWRSTASSTQCQGTTCVERRCERKRIGPCAVTTCTIFDGPAAFDLAPSDMRPPSFDLGFLPSFDLATAPSDLGAARVDAGQPPSELPETLPSAGPIVIDNLLSHTVIPPRLCACATEEQCAACAPTYTLAQLPTPSIGTVLEVRAAGDDVPHFEASITVAGARSASLSENGDREIEVLWSDFGKSPIPPAELVVALSTAATSSALACADDESDVVPLREQSTGARIYGSATCTLAGPTEATIPAAVVAAIGSSGDSASYTICGRSRTTVEVGGWDVHLSLVAAGTSGTLSLNLK